MEQHQRRQHALDYREHTDATRALYPKKVHQHTFAAEGILLNLRVADEDYLAALLVEEDRLLRKNATSFKLVGVDELGVTEALVDIRRDIEKQVTR